MPASASCSGARATPCATTRSPAWGRASIVSGDDNVLQGNDIGTGASGKHAVANFLGILVDGGDHNLIGGTADGEGNLVPGNRSDGIRIDERATGNDLQGNLIGTTFTGRAPLPNDDDGVTINNWSENTIGGAQPGAGNVISANAGDGVSMEGFDVVEANRVLGNWIGTNKTAERDLGNGGSGVHIGFGDDNTVGDDDETSPLNTIMHNGDDGVTIENGFGNSVLRSVMADNGNLAIDLGGDGSTANDPNDLDFGSNGLQNGPEIEEATTTTAEWELETTPNAIYRLEFYACDGPGAGEGATYLGSTTTSTDANGNAHDTTTLPAPVEAGDQVAMTATRTTVAGSHRTSSSSRTTRRNSPPARRSDSSPARPFRRTSARAARLARTRDAARGAVVCGGGRAHRFRRGALGSAVRPTAPAVRPRAAGSWITPFG